MGKHRGGKRPRLSLCMIALNEEDLIAECFKSVRGLVDEIVLGLDTRTTDRTAAIARGHGARIIPIEWRDDFSYARNLTLEAARGDWLLVLDGDDQLTDKGKYAIRFVVNHPGDALALADGSGHVTGYRLSIAETNLDGSQRGKPEYQSGRLFKRSDDLRYSGIVHEEVLSVSDRSSTLWSKLPLGPHVNHVGYDPSIWSAKGKDGRNMRLLERRLAQDPDDVDTHIYLARQHSIGLRLGPAAKHACCALELLAEEALDFRTEMQGIIDKSAKLEEMLQLLGGAGLSFGAGRLVAS